MRYLWLFCFILGSLLQAEECSLTKPEAPRLILVTGCARSATTFISRFLTLNGLDVPHERIGNHGSVSWLMAVNSRRTPWGPGCDGIKFAHTFHQVRHPLKVITSVYVNEPYQSWRYICRHIPEIKFKDPLLVRCVKYWIYWNLAAEKKAEFTYRVEDAENAVEEMSRRLGIFLDKAILKQMAKNINTRKSVAKPFTWEMLSQELDPALYQQLIDLAKRYGYKTP